MTQHNRSVHHSVRTLRSAGRMASITPAMSPSLSAAAAPRPVEM